MTSQEFAVVILAGGRGSMGLYPLAEQCSKTLLPIANRPLLSYQLELFEAAGFKDVYVLTYTVPEQQQIENYIKGYKGRLKIELVMLPDELETADALYRLKDRMPRSDFIVCSGDLIAEGRFLPLMADVHRSQDALATALIKETPREEPQPGKKPAKEDSDTRDYIALDAAKKRLLLLSDSKATELESELVIPKQLLRVFPNLTIYNNLSDAHCYFFSRKVWDLMTERLQTRKKLYSIKGELLPSLIRQQYRVPEKSTNSPALDASTDHAPLPAPPLENRLQLAYQMSSSNTREERRDSVRCLVHLLEADRLCTRVNTLAAYAELNRLVASGATPFRPNEPPTKDGKSFVNEKAEIAAGAQISAGCVIGQSKIGEGTALKVSVVGNRCVIGRNVKITNSVIMDDVLIADNCTITSSILCTNVELGEKCVIKDSSLGVGFDCPPGTEIKNQKVSQEAE